VRPPHLLEVGLAWPPEAYLQRKLKGLVARGMRVTVAAEIDRNAELHQVPGVELIRLLRHSEPRRAALPKLLRQLLTLSARNPRRLRQLLRATHEVRLLRLVLPLLLADADVVHFEWESAALGVLPVFELFDAPIVVSSHGGINVRPQMGDAWMAANYARIFAHATAVHCVCDAVLQSAVRYGLDRRKACVIRTAVDTTFFMPGENMLSDRLRVVSVGELNWIKGYDDAIRAIARLVSQGVPVSYDVIGAEPSLGSKSSDRARLLYLIHDLGLPGHVRLLGGHSQEGVRQLLQQSDVLLQPSLSEGIPNAVLEAMACALPVVVTDCGGLREAVADGVQGFVCPRRSPESLAEALRTIWQDRALARRFGEAGRARVLSEFELQKQVGSFLQLYESLRSSDDRE
jgi:colanic acid/amylovoran biosynthesis glycosyltransferase